MKRLGIMAVVGIFPLAFMIWWYSEAPVRGGIYPEKHKGLEVVVIDEEEFMVPITLPVRWIKTHPWEKPPVINEISFIDDSDKIFAALGGEYELRIPHSSEVKWYNRNVGGEVELYLNGASFAEVGSISTTTIKESLEKEFALNQISMTVKNKKVKFPVDNHYKYRLITKNEQDTSQGLEGYMYFFVGGNYDLPEGFLVRLAGMSGQTLEKILFWLPGMTNDYYEGEVLYHYDHDFDQYNNATDQFDGEQLSLPLEIKNSSLLIYFPFTPEIMEVSGDSLVRLMPYFHLKNSNGDRYYVGGSGSIGSLDRRLPWNELIYIPSEH